MIAREWTERPQLSTGNLRGVSSVYPDGTDTSMQQPMLCDSPHKDHHNSAGLSPFIMTRLQSGKIVSSVAQEGRRNVEVSNDQEGCWKGGRKIGWERLSEWKRQFWKLGLIISRGNCKIHQHRKVGLVRSRGHLKAASESITEIQTAWRTVNLMERKSIIILRR